MLNKKVLDILLKPTKIEKQQLEMYAFQNDISQLRSSRSVFYQFLLNRRLGHQNSRPFLLFKKQKSNFLTDTLDMIINEYYLNAEFFDDVINNLIKVLIIQMVRSYPDLDHQILDKQSSLVMQITKDISEHPDRISLSAEAEKLGYSRNYLSNIFKKKTNETFSNALLRQRMTEAHRLTRTTTIPLTQIMKMVGIHNKTFFVKKYKARFHVLPRDDRRGI